MQTDSIHEDIKPNSERFEAERQEQGFTPGPWDVDHSADNRGVFVRAPNAGRAGAPNPAVCRVYDVLKERDANARLIAAAPALYAACQTMRKSLNGSPTDFAGMLAAHRQLDAAVALVVNPKG